jgi:hypothetical protein
MQRDHAPAVSAVDRIARVLVGLLLIAFAIPIGFPHTGWNWVGWTGVVPLLTLHLFRQAAELTIIRQRAVLRA